MLWNSTTAAFGLILTLVGSAVGKTFNAQEVVVIEFEDAEKFADFERSGEISTEELFSQAISESLQGRLTATPNKQVYLKLVFKDIDLAGRPQAINGVQLRGLKSSSPAKMLFAYKLENAEGSVILEGEQRLVDSSFLSFGPKRTVEGAFPREQTMLLDWFDRLDTQIIEAETMTAKSSKSECESNAS
ncbi:MAG: DUF3016 domain-containing protein [Opitutales bacterium]